MKIAKAVAKLSERQNKGKKEKLVDYVVVMKT